MKKWTKIAMVGVTALAVVSSLLFFNQGGFGGGHGDFDKALFIMALPWAAIPWPESLIRRDFIWLIGLPLCLNIATVLIAAAVLGSRRRAFPPAAS